MNATQPTATEPAHTPEPWEAIDHDDRYIRDERGATIAHVCDDEGDIDQTPWGARRTKANGKRIRDCVNACKGITDPADFILDVGTVCDSVAAYMRNPSDLNRGILEFGISQIRNAIATKATMTPLATKDTLDTEPTNTKDAQMSYIELPAGLPGNVVACRAMFLAYEASAVVGMGILQARLGVTEKDVGSTAAHALHNDGHGTLYADYLFGRMLKLSIRYGGSYIEPNMRPLSIDYQSWARAYPTFDALIAAAIKSLTP